MYNYLNFKVFDLRQFKQSMKDSIQIILENKWRTVIQDKYILFENVGEFEGDSVERYLMDNGAKMREIVLVQFAGFDQTITPKSNSNKNILKNTHVEAKSFHIGDITIANFS